MVYLYTGFIRLPLHRNILSFGDCRFLPNANVAKKIYSRGQKGGGQKGRVGQVFGNKTFLFWPYIIAKSGQRTMLANLPSMKVKKVYKLSENDLHEKLHTKFCKSNLQVKLSNVNIVCRAELRQFPLTLDVNTQIIKYHDYLDNLPLSRPILIDTVKCSKNLNDISPVLTTFGSIDQLKPVVVLTAQPCMAQIFRNTWHV